MIHIHYEEFVAMAVRAIDNFPELTSVYISTSSLTAYKQLNEALAGRAEIRLVENRGRNFGPMLTVFRENLSRHDLIFHLHSKKSMHSSKTLGKGWNDSLWHSLSGSRRHVDRILALFQSESSIGVVYPDVSEFVKPTSLAWSLNYGRAKKWLSGIGLLPRKDPLDFPAGGMFAARTKAITHLLDFGWSIEDFPEELGQMDGETHHMVERLIGVLPLEAGFSHAVHHKSSDSFVKLELQG
jgi:lipopolysaccharide biosynthesis protein